MLFFVLNKRICYKASDPSKMLTSNPSSPFNILFSRLLSEYTWMPLSFLPKYQKEETVIENTEALFGKTKYNLLEAKLNTFADCIQHYLQFIHSNHWLLVKISKLVPYSLQTDDDFTKAYYQYCYLNKMAKNDFCIYHRTINDYESSQEGFLMMWGLSLYFTFQQDFKS